MANELNLRLWFFLGVLLLIILLEYIWPRRTLKIQKNTRWVRNLSLVIINSIAVKALVPFTLVSVAMYAEQHQIGLFNFFSMPFILSLIFSIILLDFLIYAQHVFFHSIPLLWRLHKVHHIDQEIDVTTGVRFHPIEIILSILIKSVAVLVFGIPFIAVLIFEILLNASAMFNHGNINLPVKLDKFIRKIIVTPDMHRVHHSVIVNETNRNFGFNLSWWDKIFGTYKAQPADGHLKMNIGLNEYRSLRKTSLLQLLLIPFRMKIK